MGRITLFCRGLARVARALLKVLSRKDGIGMRRRTPVAWALPALFMLACGASTTTAADSFAPAGAEAGAPGATPPTPAEPPPEKEVESDYQAPVATGSFVWIANPKSGRVAYVDATTLQVRTVEAGNGPTFLGAVPGATGDTTLVLNVLSEDATLLHAEGGTITTKTLHVAKQANSLAFSSDGRPGHAPPSRCRGP